MIKEFKKHSTAYLTLLVFLVSFVLLFMHFWPDRTKQRVLSVVLMVCYFSWGVVTHTKTKRLTKSVVLEYLAVSLLAGVILILLTF